MSEHTKDLITKQEAEEQVAAARQAALAEAAKAMCYICQREAPVKKVKGRYVHPAGSFVEAACLAQAIRALMEKKEG